MKRDPIEENPKYQKKIQAAEDEARKNLRDRDHGMGFCHQLWTEKKRILKEKYHIDWKTPQEMNPYTKFD